MMIPEYHSVQVSVTTTDAIDVGMSALLGSTDLTPIQVQDKRTFSETERRPETISDFD